MKYYNELHARDYSSSAQSVASLFYNPHGQVSLSFTTNIFQAMRDEERPIYSVQIIQKQDESQGLIFYPHSNELLKRWSITDFPKMRSCAAQGETGQNECLWNASLKKIIIGSISFLLYNYREEKHLNLVGIKPG